MDRNYFYQKISAERQREISKELAARNLLKQAGGEPASGSRPGRLVLLGVPAVVALIALVILQVL